MSCNVRIDTSSDYLLGKPIMLGETQIGYVNFGMHAKELTITNIKIFDEHQNQGYGTQVIKILEQKAKQNSCERLFVFHAPNSRSERFWLRNGFIVVEKTAVFCDLEKKL